MMWCVVCDVWCSVGKGKVKWNGGQRKINQKKMLYTYFPTHLTTASPEDVANTPCPAQIIKLFPLPPLILTWITILINNKHC